MTSQAQEKPAGAARKDPGLAKSRKAGKRGAKSSSQVLYWATSSTHGKLPIVVAVYGACHVSARIDVSRGGDEQWVVGSGVRRYAPFGISRFKKLGLPVAQSAPRNKRKDERSFWGWATTRACYIIHTHPYSHTPTPTLGHPSGWLVSGVLGSNDNKAADDFRVLTADCWLDFPSQPPDLAFP